MFQKRSQSGGIWEKYDVCAAAVVERKSSPAAHPTGAGGGTRLFDLLGSPRPQDAAVAFAIRRQLYRVALGFRPHENKASSQRDFPMPGRAEPHCWQARDPRDPHAQVPGPQPIGDPPPRMTGLHVFASKWHENRAAKLAADQPVPDISVEEAWANLPPETRERFEQVARKGGK